MRLEVWLVRLEYVPMMHCLHCTAPGTSDQLPKPHGLQVPALLAPSACE